MLGTGTKLEPSGGRLHGLDHLRALAILLVLLFHYHVYYGIPEIFSPTGLPALSAFGWSGVDLFFVLSGYLIGDKLLSDLDRFDRIRFTTFYANRAFRILPAYLAVVAIYFTIAELREGRALPPLWTFLTFTQNLPKDLYANTFSHAWSLSVEGQFYLIFPVLLFFVSMTSLRNRLLYFLLALVVFGVLVRYFSWLEYVEPVVGRRRIGAALKYLYYPTYTRLDGLAVGVAIAAAFRYQPKIRELLTRHGNFMLFAGLALLVGCYHLFGGNILSESFTTLETTLIGFPLVSISYGMMVVSALSPNSFLFRIQFRPSAMLATLSYAIYLVHKMTNHWINTRSAHYFDLNDVQVFVACLVAAIAGGLLLHLVIEKRFLRLRERLIT